MKEFEFVIHVPSFYRHTAEWTRTNCYMSVETSVFSHLHNALGMSDAKSIYLHNLNGFHEWLKRVKLLWRYLEVSFCIWLSFQMWTWMKVLRRELWKIFDFKGLSSSVCLFNCIAQRKSFNFRVFTGPLTGFSLTSTWVPSRVNFVKLEMVNPDFWHRGIVKLLVVQDETRNVSPKRQKIKMDSCRSSKKKLQEKSREQMENNFFDQKKICLLCRKPSGSPVLSFNAVRRQLKRRFEKR